MNKDFYLDKHILIEDSWSGMSNFIYSFAVKGGFGDCNIEYDNGNRFRQWFDKHYMEHCTESLTVKKYNIPILLFQINNTYGSIYNNSGQVTPKTLISQLYDINNKVLKETLDEIGLKREYEDMVYQ